MSRHPELYQWIDTIVMRFPSLSKPQALGLALWSFGMVIAGSCSLTAVADVLAPLLGQSYNTLRERLRDTYREAGANALDATSLGDRFVVLAISVVYRGCAVPVAWKSLKSARETRMEAGMAGVVETVSRSFARRLDGHCIGGSWLIREVVI